MSRVARHTGRSVDHTRAEQGLGRAVALTLLGVAALASATPGSADPLVRLAQNGSSMMNGPKAPPAKTPPVPSGGAGSMMSGSKPAASAPVVPVPVVPAVPAPAPTLAAPAPQAPVPQAPAPASAATAPPAGTPKPTVVAPAAIPPVSPPPAVVVAPPPPGPFAIRKSATGYSVDNLRVVLGQVELRAEKAEISGSDLSQDELAKLLDPDSSLPVAERLRRFQATEIAAPTVLAIKGSDVGELRSVVLKGVASGRIASVEIGGAKVAEMSFSHASASEVDVGALADLSSATVPGQDVAQPKKIYAALSFEGLSFSTPEHDRSWTLAHVESRDFAIRQTPHGWAADAATIGPSQADDVGPTKPVRAALADMYDAVSVGSVAISGFSTADTNDATGARLAHLAFTGSAGSEGASVTFDGFEVRSGGTHIRLTSFSLGNASLAPLMNGLRSSDRSPEKWEPADMRRFVPTIGTLRLGGLSVDGLAAATGGDEVDRFEIGAVEVRSEKPVGGIPSEVQFALRDITVPVPAVPTSDGMRQLAGMGYSKVQASFATAVGWDAASQQLAIREWSVRSADMGSITVRGVIGNVSADLFSPDQALAQIAAVGTAVKAVDVTVQNDGLAERLLAQKAKDAGRSVDDLRRELGVGAAILIPAQLGGSAGAKTLGQAVGKFIAKPSTLKVELRAKKPEGVGIADYLSDPDPATLLDSFDLNATVQ